MYVTMSQHNYPPEYLNLNFFNFNFIIIDIFSGEGRRKKLVSFYFWVRLLASASNNCVGNKEIKGGKRRMCYVPLNQDTSHKYMNSGRDRTPAEWGTDGFGLLIDGNYTNLSETNN